MYGGTDVDQLGAGLSEKRSRIRKSGAELGKRSRIRKSGAESGQGQAEAGQGQAESGQGQAESGLGTHPGVHPSRYTPRVHHSHRTSAAPGVSMRRCNVGKRPVPPRAVQEKTLLTVPRRM